MAAIRQQKNKIAGFIVFSVLVLFLGNPVWADMIYFKNGGTIEGIIKEENDTSIIIDLGIGTMTVRKDEIERIEKSSADDDQRLEQERRTGEISRGEWAPLGYEEIRMAYLKAKDDKESLKKSRNNSLTSKEETLQKEKKISELLKILDEKSKELKTIDSDKRTKEYNAVVAEINSISARLNTENNELKDLYAEEKELNITLIEKANKYRANFQAFKDVLSTRKVSVNSAEASADELTFLEGMQGNMAEMDNDFKKDVVGYSAEGNQVIVSALINDIALTRLVVDTGASIVVISKEVADRLGISPEEGTGEEIEIIMANGMSVNARPVVLKSIKVGDAEVENVRAAILESSVVGGADGLLGMSFLSNFIISVDTSSNKLILEQVL